MPHLRAAFDGINATWGRVASTGLTARLVARKRV
jgi:hypothetical protein